MKNSLLYIACIISCFCVSCSKMSTAVETNTSSKEAVLQNSEYIDYILKSAAKDYYKVASGTVTLEELLASYDNSINVQNYKGSYCITKSLQQESELEQKVPEYLLVQLDECLYDENLELLPKVIDAIYKDKWYLSLPADKQQEISYLLEELNEIRDSVVDTVEEYVPQVCGMSPGDHMMWSDMAKHMSPNDRKMVRDATVYGATVCFPTTSTITNIVSAVYMVFSWFA